MTSRQLILALVILIGIGIVFTAGKLLIAPPPQNPTPTPTETITETAIITASPGVVIINNGTSIKPLEVIEDSRCAVDVQCIQAGTVRLKALINSAEQIVSLNVPVTVGQKTLTMTKVEPIKYANKQIAPADYRFTFEIK